MTHRQRRRAVPVPAPGRPTGRGPSQAQPELLHLSERCPGELPRFGLGTSPGQLRQPPGPRAAAGGCPPAPGLCKGQEKMAVGTIRAGDGG